MRKLTGFWKYYLVVVSLALVCFQLYTAIFGNFIDFTQRSIHVAFVLAIGFIATAPVKAPKDPSKVGWYDIVLCIIGVIACINVIVHTQQLITGAARLWFGWYDYALAICLVLLIFELSRRTVGWTFIILTVILLVYALFGEWFPGSWMHKNLSLSNVMLQLYHTTTGIWGSMMGLSAGMIAIFCIFGEVLGSTGGSQTFINLSRKLTSKFTGGSGKVSLISSGLFGMVNGASASVVLATGTFTIPHMKKDGYSPEWAGAISAVGGTGGQIMPPIMGATAFMMAEMISVPYALIAKSAILPAILYYFGAFVALHYISKKFGVFGRKEKITFNIWEIIIILCPMVVFVALIILGYTVSRAALIGTIISLITCAVTIICKAKVHLPLDDVIPGGIELSRLKRFGYLLYHSGMNAANGIVMFAAIMLGSQLVITLVSYTGLGVKLTRAILAFGHGNLFICLLISMVVCIILGMGLPTAPAYVLGASLIAPTLSELGLPLLISHMFVFYYTCLSAITPPDCVAVFVGAKLANANWWKTGWLACFIALPAFIVPFAFAYDDALLLNGSFGEIAIVAITACMGTFLVGIGVAGYINKDLHTVVRILFIAAGILMIIPKLGISMIGLVIGVILYVIFGGRKRKLEIEA